MGNDSSEFFEMDNEGRDTVDMMNFTNTFLDILFTATQFLFRDIISTVEDYKEDDKNVTYTIIVSLVAVVGLVGNFMTILVTFHENISRYSYAIYLRVTAVSDSLVLLNMASEDIMSANEVLEFFLNQSIHGKRLWRFSQMTSTVASPFLLVALSLDRCIAISLPFYKTRFCSKKIATIVCTGVMAVSVGLSIYIVYSEESLTNAMNNLLREALRGDSEDDDGRSFEDEIDYRDEIISEEQMKELYDQLTASLGEESKQLNVWNIMYIKFALHATLPCFLLAILNSIVVVKIRQSLAFRKKSVVKDGNWSSLRASIPLIVVTVLAFLTLFPVAITEIIELIKSDGLRFESEEKDKLDVAWSTCNAIYLMNFAQNFYILVASSQMYRRVAKCVITCSFRPSTESRQPKVALNPTKSKQSIRTIEQNIQ